MVAAELLESEAGGASIPCKRCKLEAATQHVRQDPVCENCFTQYVSTKAVKRLELQRTHRSALKKAQKRLLPISFGPSSTSLLYIVDKQLLAQFERMGKTLYELYVVHVDLHSWEPDGRQEIEKRVDGIKAIFPRHSYSTIGIEESLNIPSINWTSLGLPDQIISPEADLKTLKSRFRNLIESLPSPTSRSDVISTLLNRLLLSYASTHDCASILFGDSTTRLAERTLTSTATGRGFSLPWLVSDGPSPTHFPPNSNPENQSLFANPINITYPLRDILKREIITFTHLHPTLTPLTTYDPSYKTISASNKATTINELMIQYFESVEENYPSIVANVVRTGSKLVAPVSTVSNGEIDDLYDDVIDGGMEPKTKACGLCNLPVAPGTDGIFGWGGDQNDDDVSVRRAEREENVRREQGKKARGILCYGCSRSVNG